jgi:hypothetical protein
MFLGLSPACRADSACPNGPVTLTLEPFPTGSFPPAIFDPGYTISPCDTVTWDFGDGTAQSVVGTDRITHDYPSPGNYVVKATVTNSLGSETVSYAESNGAVIATSPARLSFATGSGEYPDGACDDCIVVGEDNGPLPITVLRSLDLSRSISTEAVVTDYATSKVLVRATLLFGPGETSKSFTVPITDDDIFSGVKKYCYLTFANTTGGTLTKTNATRQPAIVVVDDDPRPILSIEPTATISEGDAGLSTVTIPYHLSAPMGIPCFPLVLYDPAGVGGGYIVSSSNTSIEAGKTTGVAVLTLRGNTLPEPDKSFQLRMRQSTDAALLGVAVSTVTVLNDDAALYPAQTTVAANAPTLLSLDVGSPYLASVIAVFTSSAPDVVPAPAPISIPAGATIATVALTPRAAGRAQISAVVPARTTQPATINVTAPSVPRRRAATH